ncbi:MAG: hypothetical protein ACD_31C00002G0018 [uncultured bacterium]|uniref:Uncharacterized protein n=4 Tax=Microgenomates group TaxID=1794810 RepID=A0A1F5K6N1_9BACT|nr:MAG: hypothetical protein ACD_31C00002G0018 [uncultured bacterium]KKQ15644.1 MAG: hypothetical protein US28_C0013G0023 [Candidatus Daviesbacteria bacterium GW2011_GWA1_36_8]KKQ73977.1 MAG: hypothetical protein US96_C0045G0003 [Candidatus Woesebacteria bacterium GW2011_GWB1_38_5b]OGE17497.1 MAG: hypothetical protein A2858_01150 [Candidatus Daviesbacteria bacterium RIFCSPHIGHO2_01_FULL_36_37]OGE36592.1 MAG: hypothetical protein A3E66_02995 [Candidatus Daviesbacteria bacterium RIFCSPHIGHO2_12_F
MLESRIEPESDHAFKNRKERIFGRSQTVWEFCWDLRDMYPNKVTEFIFSIADEADSRIYAKQIGRKRFLRLVGPLKLPLTSIKEPNF